MDFPASQCRACERKSPDGPTCEAYPSGIPLSILTDGADHRVPQPGDGGKLFMIADREDAEQEFDFWAQVYDSTIR